MMFHKSVLSYCNKPFSNYKMMIGFKSCICLFYGNGRTEADGTYHAHAQLVQYSVWLVAAPFYLISVYPGLCFLRPGTVSFVDLFADLRQRYQFSIYNSFSFLSLLWTKLRCYHEPHKCKSLCCFLDIVLRKL